MLGLRPEHLGRAGYRRAAPGHVRIPAAVDLVQPTGSRTYISILLGGIAVTAEVEPHEVGQAGEAIEIELDMNKAVLIDPADGQGHLSQDRDVATRGLSMATKAPSRAIKLFGTTYRQQGAGPARRAAFRGAG